MQFFMPSGQAKGAFLQSLLLTSTCYCSVLASSIQSIYDYCDKSIHTYVLGIESGVRMVMNISSYDQCKNAPFCYF